jgi:hypothetical protein
MNPINFSHPETNYLGLQFASENENNFTCIARCLYQNPNGISLACDYDQRYCGQTDTPTSQPTPPNLASSSNVVDLNSAEMSSLIIGLVVLLLILFCLFYYFCCYANVTVKGRDEDLIHRTSFIDIDMLKENRKNRQSNREFDSYINDINNSEDGSSYEDGFNYMNPSYRHFHEGNNFSESESDDDATSSHPSHRSSFSGAMPTSKNSLDGQDALNAWNEDLIDFHKGNAHIPEVTVPEGFFNIEDANIELSTESDSASDDSNQLVSSKYGRERGRVVGESDSSENGWDEDDKDDNETYATLFIHNEAQTRKRVPVIYENDGDGDDDHDDSDDSTFFQENQD